MDVGRPVDHIELALIELEYARADFAYCEATTSDRLELADLKAFLAQLAVADLALRMAIGALARRPGNPDVDPQSKATPR